MSKIVEMQALLPRTIWLVKHCPDRNDVRLAAFNPAQVSSVDDLPEYLILGSVDPSRCEFSDTGWYGRWQGLESGTHFEIKFCAVQERYEIRQTWCGVDGGLSWHPSRLPLSTLIPQTLYMSFPRGWDREAKKTLEDTYQLTYLEQPESLYSFCGVPDGAFRTIAFPVNIKHLRGVRKGLEDLAKTRNPPYPFSAEAKLVFQAVNYIEGKAPEWSRIDGTVFRHSLTDTGMVPHGLPVREVASDGSAAWTLRRDLYYLFVCLPFAGLNHFLELLASPRGPVRKQTDEPLRGELQPIILPAGIETQVERIALSDRGKTIRTTLVFDNPDKTQAIEASKNLELTADDDLSFAERTSAAVGSAIEDIVRKQ